MEVLAVLLVSATVEENLLARRGSRWCGDDGLAMGRCWVRGRSGSGSGSGWRGRRSRGAFASGFAKRSREGRLLGKRGVDLIEDTLIDDSLFEQIFEFLEGWMSVKRHQTQRHEE